MSAQLKREITDRKNVRIPKVVLDALDANVGDVLKYDYDNEQVIVTKYGPEASN